jgi:AcrR family transcriptional regulator
MPSDTSRNAPAGPTTGSAPGPAAAPLRPGSASARTREQLILAGERLFALHGIDNVSLRQINTEAGQRNSSAAHYHFGSKEALIRAIYDYRMDRIDQRRRALLDTLEAGGRDRDVRALLSTLVQPLLEEVDDTPGGANYIRFLAQLFSHPSLELRTVLRSEFAESVGRIFYRLRMVLPTIPDELFAARFGFAWELTVSGLAERTRRLESAGPGGVIDTLPGLFVGNLLDATVALLTAPVSADTGRELARLRAQESA